MAGAEGDWRPWLKSELEKLGYEVLNPEMPDRDVPVIEKWVSKLSEVVGTVDKDTFFVGHSIGCQAIMRYLEKTGMPAGGALFIAGWFNLLNLEDRESEEIARPWVETPIDLVKVKNLIPKSTLIISDNDPYDCFEENERRFAELGSKIMILKNAGHIDEESGFTELQVALEEMQKMVG